MPQRLFALENAATSKRLLGAIWRSQQTKIRQAAVQENEQLLLCRTMGEAGYNL
jgi:hypothetical protein